VAKARWDVGGLEVEEHNLHFEEGGGLWAEWLAARSLRAEMVEAVMMKFGQRLVPEREREDVLGHRRKRFLFSG
jgi:hypothetical protein